MKKLFLLSAVLLTGILACKKDDVGGDKPKIQFKSYSMEEVPANFQGLFVVTLDVEDGDGNIEDSLFIQANWVAPFAYRPYDRKKMPGIGAYKGTNLKAQVQIQLDNNFIGPSDPVSPPEFDSMFFKIYIRDNAQNISDTIITPNFRVRN